MLPSFDGKELSAADIYFTGLSNSAVFGVI